MLSAVVTAAMLSQFAYLSGCEDMAPSIYTTRATTGYTTDIHNDLISLPPPKDKIVIAIYKFRDQTGQYKTSAQATTFSTAVTQGATSMLIKVLEDSGWFIPIEREGLANLLNERKIIRSTRMQYKAEGSQTLSSLPPLLYAGVLLEGGIIGYDNNLITGGLGIKYFGLGGSGQLRKDKVTIYLRLVSVRNGGVLKSVSTTKSILSREVDFGIYRFVSVKRLLEAETGLSTNEPTTICVLEAIEKAVYDLIIEGILDGIWELKNSEDISSQAIQNYLKEKQETEKTVVFDNEGNLVEIKDTEGPEYIEESEPEGVEDIVIADEIGNIVGVDKIQPEDVNNNENIEKVEDFNSKASTQ